MRVMHDTAAVQHTQQAHRRQRHGDLACSLGGARFDASATACSELPGCLQFWGCEQEHEATVQGLGAAAVNGARRVLDVRVLPDGDVGGADVP